MRKLWSDSGTGTGSVTEPGTGSSNGLHWWFRYRCKIQFWSGPNLFQLVPICNDMYQSELTSTNLCQTLPVPMPILVSRCSLIHENTK